MPSTNTLCMYGYRTASATAGYLTTEMNPFIGQRQQLGHPTAFVVLDRCAAIYILWFLAVARLSIFFGQTSLSK